MSENSAEMAGGTAYGLNASIDITDASVIDLLDSAMLEVGKWINDTAGMFLGHVKMAITTGEFGSMTLNLTNLDVGVEHHGSMVFPLPAKIRFMAAVLDVDQKELSKRMETSLKSRGFDVERKIPGNIVQLG